eukprot:TRINITY_DN4814_c2_g1_i1.p1 TRINITY_DN4814_c2_g1~~TRINITY_DN4814_c2_g1_i1.p1  ORF type:complete len:428 (-),score=55.15 TRINITY_DN4814_c2_g1_i1:947-2230(-)
MGDDFQALVCDIGTGTAKFGYSSDERPQCVFQNVMGELKAPKVMLTSMTEEKEIFVGDEAMKKRGVLSLKYQNREAFDSVRLQSILDYALYQRLKCDPQEHPMLLTESPLADKIIREKTAMILFELYRPPAIFFGIEAILALYASGRNSGLVMGCGDSFSYTVPVYDWKAQLTGIQKVAIAGRDITEQMIRLLCDKGKRLTTSSEKEVARSMKEEFSYIPMDPKKESSESVVYTLPDGETIMVDDERYKAPEILFHPRIIGQDTKGIHKMAIKSILNTNRMMQESLFNALLLTGGSTLTPGFGQRVEKEVKKKLRRTFQLKVVAPKNRAVSAWVGGSVLSSLSSFKGMWISRRDFDERGANAIHQCSNNFVEIQDDDAKPDLMHSLSISKPSFTRSVSFSTAAAADGIIDGDKKKEKKDRRPSSFHP